MGGIHGDSRPVFLEQSWRAGVVVGREYYARNHRPDASPELPARNARLGGDGPLPDYTPAGRGEPAALEPLLTGFLASTREQPAGARHERVSDAIRERLRALGYEE